MDSYVVFGNPIGYSKSPLIHRLFAEQTGQRLDYQTALAPLDDFPAFAQAFFHEGRGANDASQGEKSAPGAGTVVCCGHNSSLKCDAPF